MASARAAGLNVFGETCPQYLALDESRFKSKDGYLYSCCPPIRTRKDNAALWEAVRRARESSGESSGAGPRVGYLVALDETFSQVVAEGEVATDAERDG